MGGGSEIGPRDHRCPGDMWKEVEGGMRCKRQVHGGRQAGRQAGQVHNLVWKAGETIDEADWPPRLEAVVTAQM